MSSWGNLDNVTISGTVVVATANGNAVLGVSTVFETNVKAGDYLTIASNKYQVEKVIDDTHIYLTSNAATTSAGVTAFLQQGPKYIANANVLAEGTNVYTIQNIYGVDRNEITVPENKNRGFSHTGWTHYNTYTTEQGETRYKSEVIVAMSKNFASNITGDLFGTGAGQDANDDTVLADYLLYFTTQPANTSNSAGNSAVLVSVAATSPSGETINYQWSYRDNVNDTTYTNVINGNGITGNTTNTLTITNVSNVNGNIFRVTISGTGGADSNTSDTATVTVV